MLLIAIIYAYIYINMPADDQDLGWKRDFDDPPPNPHT